jgi:arginine deiminase
MKISLIEIGPDDDGAIINSLAIAPGRVMMPEGVSEQTADQLQLAGVEVITVPYEHVISGGGGLHCSTAPLIRDAV